MKKNFFNIRFGQVSKFTNEKYSHCVSQIVAIVDGVENHDSSVLKALTRLKEKEPLIQAIKTKPREQQLTAVINEKSAERYRIFSLMKYAIKSKINSIRMSEKRAAELLNKWLELYKGLLVERRIHDTTKGIINLKIDYDNQPDIVASITDLELTTEFEMLCLLNDKVNRNWMERVLEREKNERVTEKYRKEVSADFRALAYALMSLAETEAADENRYKTLCVKVNAFIDTYLQQHTTRINAQNRNNESGGEADEVQTVGCEAPQPFIAINESTGQIQPEAETLPSHQL